MQAMNDWQLAKIEQITRNNIVHCNRFSIAIDVRMYCVTNSICDDAGRNFGISRYARLVFNLQHNEQSKNTTTQPITID